MGRSLLRHASFGLYNHSILIEYSIIIRYTITVVIYCHIDMHCRSLLCVPEYFSSQYSNNANPSIFSSVNKLHYMLCSCVCVCAELMDNHLNLPNECFPPSICFHHTNIKLYNVCGHLPTHMSVKPETFINSCHKHNL